MYRCPRCNFQLKVVKNKGVELDHCPHCRGTFLDKGEVAEVLGAPTSPEFWRNSSIAGVIAASQLKCPKDDTAFATYQLEFGKQIVEVDLCEQCGGIWLDPEECKKLHDIVLEAGQRKETNLVKQAGPGSYIFQLLSGFPMEVWNPRRRRPWSTIAIISLIYAVFGIEIFTYIEGGTFAVEKLFKVFGLIPEEIVSGRGLWTVVTSTFFHQGLAHIIGNTYFLYVFGDNVEDTLGRRRFFLIYFVSAIVGAALEIAVHPHLKLPVIGASGAVAGLMGAYFILFPSIKIYIVLFFVRFRLGVLWFLGIWLTYNVIMAFTGQGQTAWLVHIGGFLMGGLLGYWYRPKPLSMQLQP